MNSQNKIEEAKHCLIDFFGKMYEWESAVIEMEERADNDEITEDEIQQYLKQAKADLELIFEEFCEVGKTAKRLRDEGLAFSIPPEYDLEENPIESILEKNNKVIIETKPASGLGFCYRYELINTDNGWKIRDNRKHATLTPDAKWSSDLL
ncbi:NTF2 fold immunity protein [Gimesia chilikensis]|uniref:NTF2 fold immunity protein n=1 Tax=Gimesia chilikensis TaxID=2605989 RepID=UPI001659C4CB|nr:NTF2 fold immunity protein [Gimesia chilikensis]